MLLVKVPLNFRLPESCSSKHILEITKMNGPVTYLHNETEEHSQMTTIQPAHLLEQQEGKAQGKEIPFCTVSW